MKIESTKGVLSLDEATLCFNVEAEGESWELGKKTTGPVFSQEREKVFFSDAASIRHEAVKNGIGKGIRSSYSGFTIAGEKKELAFETYAWIEECTGDVFFEWVPIKESGEITKLFWPGPMAFEEKREDWYTLVKRTPGLSDSQYLGSSEPPAAFQGTVLHSRRLHVLVFPDPGGKRLHRHRPHALEWFH